MQGEAIEAVTIRCWPAAYRGVKANVHGAEARLEEARLQQQQVQRSAALDIANTYTTVEAALNRMVPLEKGVDAAKRSHQAQVKDYRHGMVNNLDVLTALQTLQDVRRDYIRSKGEAKRLYWKLEAATGEML